MGLSRIFVFLGLLLTFLLINVNGKVVMPALSDSEQSPNELEKRAGTRIKIYPFPRKNKSSGLNYFPSDVEFVDETDNSIRKRFGNFRIIFFNFDRFYFIEKIDNYGHMRFGKRDGGKLDDYGDYG